MSLQKNEYAFELQGDHIMLPVYTFKVSAKSGNRKEKTYLYCKCNDIGCSLRAQNFVPESGGR